MKKIVVKQRENEEEIPAEILAQSIKKIGDGYDRMKRAGLSQRAIVALLRDCTGLPQRDIKTVLWGLDSLKKLYLA